MTDTQTDGHGDSMTDPAQRADSVKKNGYGNSTFVLVYSIGNLRMILSITTVRTLEATEISK